jgi:hypothetical protein
MSILSWNCRGLGNPQIVHDLCRLVKNKKPALVFVMETKMINKNCDFLRIKLGFDFMFGVDCVGCSGGLLLFWKADFQVDVQNYSRRHISAVVSGTGWGPAWKLTCFYGYPETAKKKESWALLRHVSHFQPSPWLCVRDFNEVVQMSEIQGTNYRPRWQMEDFQRGLEDSGLHDLGFQGPKFTWSNG